MAAYIILIHMTLLAYKIFPESHSYHHISLQWFALYSPITVILHTPLLIRAGTTHIVSLFILGHSEEFSSNQSLVTF